MSGMYLIKRGPRPSYHVAPFHPVIICAKKRIAKVQAGCTGDKAWVWTRDTCCDDGLGFLLARWRGLDIDYGNVVHNVGPLPDGTHTGFFHERKLEPWSLLFGAVWWDDKPLPEALAEWGVIYPPDEHSRQSILDHIANDGCSGFGRPEPSYWPKLP